MSIRFVVSALSIVMVAVSLSACGGTKVTTTNEVSVGQQLSDLDRARSQGIIDEGEYKRLKKALIKRYD